MEGYIRLMDFAVTSGLPPKQVATALMTLGYMETTGKARPEDVLRVIENLPGLVENPSEVRKEAEETEMTYERFVQCMRDPKLTDPHVVKAS